MFQTNKFKLCFFNLQFEIGNAESRSDIEQESDSDELPEVDVAQCSCGFTYVFITYCFCYLIGDMEIIIIFTVTSISQ